MKFFSTRDRVPVYALEGLVELLILAYYSLSLVSAHPLQCKSSGWFLCGLSTLPSAQPWVHLCMFSLTPLFL